MKNESRNLSFSIFIDTDVIIDFLIDRQPHAVSSSKIFELCENEIIEIFTSSLCINNVHYIIRRAIGEKKAREVITELLELIQVLRVNKADILNALKSDFKDFEDAIQHSVAVNEKSIKSIITRNTRDYRKSKMSVFAPDTFIKMVKNEQ